MSGQGMPGSGAMAPSGGGDRFSAMPPTQQGGGAPPFQPPGMGGGAVGGPMPPQPQPPMPAPPAQGGWVDAGFGQGALNAQGMQWGGQGPAPAPKPASAPNPAQTSTTQPGLKQNGGGSPPFAPPVATPPMGMQNKMTVHNPTGAGATQASQMAAARRPIPSTAPKAQGMMPPTPQTAGTGKK